MEILNKLYNGLIYLNCFFNYLKNNLFKETLYIGVNYEMEGRF